MLVICKLSVRHLTLPMCFFSFLRFADISCFLQAEETMAKTRAEVAEVGTPNLETFQLLGFHGFHRF